MVCQHVEKLPKGVIDNALVPLRALSLLKDDVAEIIVVAMGQQPI
jgi:hypothetical protein